MKADKNRPKLQQRDYKRSRVYERSISPSSVSLTSGRRRRARRPLAMGGRCRLLGLDIRVFDVEKELHRPLVEIAHLAVLEQVSVVARAARVS